MCLYTNTNTMQIQTHDKHNYRRAGNIRKSWEKALATVKCIDFIKIQKKANKYKYKIQKAREGVDATKPEVTLMDFRS